MHLNFIAERYIWNFIEIEDASGASFNRATHAKSQRTLRDGAGGACGGARLRQSLVGCVCDVIKDGAVALL